jgi:hypothetical protein
MLRGHVGQLPLTMCGTRNLNKSSISQRQEKYASDKERFYQRALRLAHIELFSAQFCSALRN